MSVQWTFIATLLYVEIALTVLLLLPFLSAARWCNIFSSRLFTNVRGYVNYYFYICMAVLVMCFIDSIREMNKYSHSGKESASMSAHPNAIDHIHMRLFRAQRNFYIAGFSLFLWFVLRRLITLICTEADLEARLTDSQQGDQPASDETPATAEPSPLSAELNEMRDQVANKDRDIDSLKRQVDETNTQFDRLTEDYQELQIKYDDLANGAGDKKAD